MQRVRQACSPKHVHCVNGLAAYRAFKGGGVNSVVFGLFGRCAPEGGFALCTRVCRVLVVPTRVGGRAITTHTAAAARGGPVHVPVRPWRAGRPVSRPQPARSSVCSSVATTLWRWRLHARCEGATDPARACCPAALLKICSGPWSVSAPGPKPIPWPAPCVLPWAKTSYVNEEGIRARQHDDMAT